jgi:hypothetical protein
LFDIILSPHSLSTQAFEKPRFKVNEPADEVRYKTHSETDMDEKNSDENARP